MFKSKKLSEILDDKNRKLTVDELKHVLVQLCMDCWAEYYKENSRVNASNIDLITYSVEASTFQIALDLLEHLKY